MKLSNGVKKKIKGTLKEYNLIKSKIKCIEIELKYENDENRIEHLNQIKEYNESFILPIEEALKEMDYKEQQILKLKYLDINTKTWDEIAYVLGYSSDYCRKDLLDKCLIKIYNNSCISK